MVREYQEFLISIQQNPDMLSDSLALEQNHFFVSIRYLYSTNAWGAGVSWCDSHHQAMFETLLMVFHAHARHVSFRM